MGHHKSTPKEIDSRKRSIDIWVDYVANEKVTFQSLAIKHGVTRERIRQIYCKVCRWIRHPGYKRYYSFQLTEQFNNCQNKAMKLPYLIALNIYDVLMDDCCGKLVPAVYLSI